MSDNVQFWIELLDWYENMRVTYRNLGLSVETWDKMIEQARLQLVESFKSAD